MQQTFWYIKIMIIKNVQHMHLEILLVFYIVEQPKFALCLSIYLCCYGNSFGRMLQVTIISKLQRYQKQLRSEIILTYGCL